MNDISLELSIVGTHLNLENLSSAEQDLLELSKPAIRQIASSCIDGAVAGLCDFANEESLDPKRPLRIVRLEPSQYAKIAQVMRAWQAIAIAKMRKIPDAGGNAAFYSQLFDSSEAIGWILEELTGKYDYIPKNPEETKEIFVCMDENGQYHGIIFLTEYEHSLYIDFLATNPINIRCPMNDLENLKEIANFKDLKNLVDLINLKHLIDLRQQNCRDLESLEDFKTLEQLEDFKQLEQLESDDLHRLLNSDLVQRVLENPLVCGVLKNKLTRKIIEKNCVRKVLENHSAQGAGTLLMKYIENKAIKSGKERISLSPSPSAINFYTFLGYEGTKQSMEKMLITEEEKDPFEG